MSFNTDDIVMTTKTGDALVRIVRVFALGSRTAYKGELVDTGETTLFTDRDITHRVEVIDTSYEAQKALWAKIGIDYDEINNR